MKKILALTLLLGSGYLCYALTHTRVITINLEDNNEQISKSQIKPLNEGKTDDGSNHIDLKAIKSFEEEPLTSQVDNYPVDDYSQVAVLNTYSESMVVKQYTGNFSMYTSSVKETDDSPFITADGTDLHKVSECIIANNKLKFGAKIYILELGTVCTVHDRMNRKNGEDHFDIYTHNDRQYALNFGRRMLTYTILE